MEEMATVPDEQSSSIDIEDEPTFQDIDDVRFQPNPYRMCPDLNNCFPPIVTLSFIQVVAFIFKYVEHFLSNAFDILYCSRIWYRTSNITCCKLNSQIDSRLVNNSALGYPHGKHRNCPVN